MLKVSGLQLVKPRFDWEACDKLTENEQFKADCKILFEGPLSDLKDKQQAGLIINWLGREATQILTSFEADTGTADDVFDALEKVFRPKSNQTMGRFKFRNLKQNAHQSVDAYMSQLRLAFPECKFKNDADDLLEDQFIFGLFNKEIQDHLLGEILETDNSVKSLYEARKIESKLEQRKMLGIVTLIIWLILMQSKRVEQPIKLMIATTVDIVMTEAAVLPMAKLATDVVGRTTLLKNVSKLIQSHAAGPEVRMTMTKNANLVANIRKIFIQLKWILIVKVAVLAIATKWGV